MLERLLRSIGVADEMVENISDTHIAFQRPLWLYALILLIPAAWFIYVRQKANLATVRTGLRTALTVTRVLVLAMLILVLASPVLRLTEEINKKPILAVVFDASQSMQLPAGPFETDEDRLVVARAAGLDIGEGDTLDEAVKTEIESFGRVELASLAVETAREEVFEKLAEKYDVQYFAFARRLEPLEEPTGKAVKSESDAAAAADSGVTVVEDDGKTGNKDPGAAATTAPPGGGDAVAADDDRGAIRVQQPNASYLGEAVLGVLDRAAGQRVSGLLVFSDGQNTGGASPADAAAAARAYRRDGAPVFAVPVGSTADIKDVAIIDVYTSGLVAKKDTVRVHATIEAHGFDGQPVNVELVAHSRDGEKILATKELVLSGTEQQQVELTYVAEESGPQYLEVRIPEHPSESEQLKANNHDVAYVRVSEDKLKVLLLDGRPRWDFRFLKNAMRRDNGLAGRLSEDDPEVVVESEWRRQPEAEQEKAFPRTIEEMAEYDVIILGDVSPEFLTREREDLLIRGVQERGVGLIVEAGPEHMPHSFGADFQELLPVELIQGQPGREAKVFEPYRMEVSASGTLHEAMQLYEDTGKNQVVWSKMPEYYWCAAIERPKAGTEVLAWNPSVELAQGKLPLISWHRAKAGKVMFIATDATWLWRRTVGDRYFYKFWGQSLRFMAPRDEKGGAKSFIEVRPVRVQPGEEATIELAAFADADGTPRNENELPVSIEGPKGTQSVVLRRDARQEGIYRGQFRPAEPGKHSVVFTPPDGDPEQATEALLNVMVAPEEFRQPQLNLATLEGLSQATGGDIIPLDQLGSLDARLTGKTLTTRRQDQATIWDNWLVLVVLVVVYSIDVGIRRLMGLS